jgi:hypothetical protein
VPVHHAAHNARQSLPEVPTTRAKTGRDGLRTAGKSLTFPEQGEGQHP